jgi:predicted RNase H-like nuclease (RuvC/YqgF family)
MTTDLEQVLASISVLSTDIRDLRHNVENLDTKVSTLDHKVAALDTKVSTLDHKVGALDTNLEISNTKFDNYQKATQWVVNLAFSLIASATVVTIISSVFRR